MKKLTRKQRERQTRRKNIMTAASKIFAEKGYYGATLEEIAHEAEYSKAALYLYFKSKEDIFRCIIKEGLNILTQNIEQTITQYDDVHVCLEEIVKTHLEFLEANKNFFKVYWEQRLYMEKKFQDDIIKEKRQIIKMFIPIIQKAQKQGMVRKIYTVEEETSILTGMITGIIWNWLTCNHEESLVDKTDMITDIFWNGLGVKE